MSDDLTDAEIETFKNTKNEDEWNNLCDRLKKSRGGQYPNDWYPKMLASGLMHKITTSWKKGGEEDVEDVPLRVRRPR